MAADSKNSPNTDLAPGRPGERPTWAPAAKSGVGCALAESSRLWFTVSRGMVTEVYHPSLDRAAIRHLEFHVAVGGGRVYRESVDCASDVRAAGAGIPAFTVTNRCAAGRFELVKEIIADPARDALVQRVRFSQSGKRRKKARLFVALSPRLGDRGEDNNGWCGSYRRKEMLFAMRARHALALGSTAPWVARTVGYVGPMDGLHDLGRHGHLTRTFKRADKGHILLLGEIDLEACDHQFMLALGFHRTAHAAGLTASLSLDGEFQNTWDEYVGGWKRWHATLHHLDRKARHSSRAREQRLRPDHSRPLAPAHEPAAAASPSVYRTSMMVLRAHRSKQFCGAGVASLSVPWGEVRGDHDLGGYHLVWPRDIVEEGAGLLAGGAHEEVRETLSYLRATQKKSGGWPQNMWLNGKCYWEGVQLDEAALPVLLLDLAHRHSAVPDRDLGDYLEMVRSAASFIIRSGPSTQEDRWENAEGLTPFTLASEIAALLVAARLAERFGEKRNGAYFRQTADLWHDLLDEWTYASGRPLAKRLGIDGYYVRIAPSPGLRTLLRHGVMPRIEHGNLPVADVVSPDALALVRFGMRAADDPRIVGTIKAIDAVTRVELPAGPCWHRYNGDTYGEHNDGRPLGPDGDVGHGRPWPLLTGERIHYEIARGNLGEARRLLSAMEGFSSQLGLLSEQVWDRADVRGRYLFRGRPSGSAMPLAWTHSEYVRAVRSLRDERVFDLPPDAWERYVRRHTTSGLALWRLDHRADSLAAGRRLRIEARHPARVEFSLGKAGGTGRVDTADTGLGIHFVDLPTDNMEAGDRVTFTVRGSKTPASDQTAAYSLVVEPPLPSQPEKST